jgi:hypothetical protein
MSKALALQFSGKLFQRPKKGIEPNLSPLLVGFVRILGKNAMNVTHRICTIRELFLVLPLRRFDRQRLSRARGVVGYHARLALLLRILREGSGSIPDVSIFCSSKGRMHTCANPTTGGDLRYHVNIFRVGSDTGVLRGRRE